MANFLHPPPQDFATEILWLIQRYVTILPKTKKKKSNHQRLHHSNLHGLEILLSGKNDHPTMIIVDESSKSSSYDDNKEHGKRVEHYLAVNEEAIEIPVENDGLVKRFGKVGRHPKRERHMPREWWKNHILPQHDEERTNMTCLDDPLNLCEELRSKDASKWKAVMQRGIQLAHDQRYMGN